MKKGNYETMKKWTHEKVKLKYETMKKWTIGSWKREIMKLWKREL